MAREGQIRLGTAASGDRIWFLFHFSVSGFGVAMALILVSSGCLRFGIGETALILAYAWLHICAFLGIVIRASWAWIFSIVVVSIDLGLHGGAPLIASLLLKHFEPTAIAFATCLLCELIALSLFRSAFASSVQIT